MRWNDARCRQSVDWLLESPEPVVRFLALRDLLALPSGHPCLAAAEEAAYHQGPLAETLAAMDPAGYWVEPGPGYFPKYTSTVWALILLAQLGASAAKDERVARACAALLDSALAPGGQFSTGGPGAPSGTADCLQGNLVWALLALGYDDPRLDLALDWLARSNTGDGVAPAKKAGKKPQAPGGAADSAAAELRSAAELRYYAGKCGPGFACGSNNRMPCAWGAAKVVLALARAFQVFPPERVTPVMVRAARLGLDFLLDNRPAEAGYPNGWSAAPNRSWWKFGFPVFYVTDILQIAEAAAALGAASDPRLAPVLDLIASKSDQQGRWALEYDYKGKTHGSYGEKGAANPYVTLRALRVLKAAG